MAMASSSVSLLRFSPLSPSSVASSPFRRITISWSPSSSNRRRWLLSSKVIRAVGYGLPDYGAPKPYHSPGGASDVLKPPSAPVPGSEPVELSTARSFWKYGAPSNYSAPVNYKTPGDYRAPSAYGPGVQGTEGQQDLVLEGGSGGGQENGNGDSGGGGGGGSGKGGQGEEGSDFSKKMSLSQKLTLAYAALVGVGGVIGFFKTGSNKSLLAGGGSALVLYYVYLTLPHNPFLASAIGLGISSMLLIVMGSRFKNSGKVFPAGVVSLFSLIMTGGYLHGMLRKSHA
jgi:uncharacterized membrane protein (UPF0136 family)